MRKDLGEGMVEERKGVVVMSGGARNYLNHS